MKRIMSFTQLAELGYSREDLKAYSREEDFPGYKSAGGGKWWVYVDDLPGWIQRHNRKREIVSEAVKRRKRRKIYGKRTTA